ncbi:MAG: flagellar hook-basal body complex protein FliE [Spirochaetaceae bacterium]|nr:flagellar hook-basal body complex protein FliE [Spirochaetaceae bacterium]MBQ8384480.1 flagellar hook-basal body complex protein FliE [Spirochaetaceae bacterium]MBR2462162.1 flagellar hook-basal body complex protein FliE [Spirochaetaceae bacterium]
MIGNLELTRTHAAHIGSSPLVSSRGVGMGQQKGLLEEAKSFDSFLAEAVDYVNGKQMASANNVEQLIVDPDSIDIHDVTTAMAEANMSLSLAQTVISRMVSSWNEITTTR